MTTATTKAKYEWVTKRGAFLNKAAQVILESDIPKSHFDNECEAMFRIALEKDIRVTRYGNPTLAQIKAARARVYAQFKRDLKGRVYDRMPDWDYED